MRRDPTGIGQEAEMAKREQSVTLVTCPVCALNGSATQVEIEAGNTKPTIKSPVFGFRIDPDSEIQYANRGVTADIVGIPIDTNKTK
jgi:hypothetical protein